MVKTIFRKFKVEEEQLVKYDEYKREILNNFVFTLIQLDIKKRKLVPEVKRTRMLDYGLLPLDSEALANEIKVGLGNVKTHILKYVREHWP